MKKANQQLKKIILEFPATSDLSKKDRFIIDVNIEKDKSYVGKWMNNFNVELKIDFFRFLEETMKEFGGKIEYK